MTDRQPLFERGRIEREGRVCCKEVGGSKEMGKYNCSLPYLSKHWKKNEKTPFLFLFFLLRSHFLTFRVLQLMLWSCKSHLE